MSLNSRIKALEMKAGTNQHVVELVHIHADDFPGDLPRGHYRESQVPPADEGVIRVNWYDSDCRRKGDEEEVHRDK